MVWGKHDFAREIQRMLVELASIKKRIPAIAEVLERIERLEASHHYLLRKLGESFRSIGEKKRGGGEKRRGSTGHRLFQQVLEQHLRALASGRGSRAIQQAATALKNLGVRRKAVELPRLDERCASCGKVLLSRVLAGEEVVVRKRVWYHRKCVQTGKGLSKTDCLN